MRFARMSAVALLALSALSLTARAADNSAVVKGIVYDTDHKPVTKAEVRLLHRDDNGKLKEVDSDYTDKDGSFQFKDVGNGTYHVVANRKGMRDRTDVTVKKGKDPEPILFNIREVEEDATERAAAKSDKKKEYVNFVGQVVDKNKNPVVGATVRLMSRDGDTVEDTDTSIAKGRFEFYKVKLGQYTIDVKKGNLHVAKKVTLEADADNTNDTQMVLK